MCGIIAGAIKNSSIQPLLLNGLNYLQYRGYDSAGIATVTEGRLDCRKVSGKISELEAALNTSPLAGSCGIAHTRWATHGVPSKQNAHPHLTKANGAGLALVHNGIVENHQQIRQELQQQGINFVSDTDSEVIVQLIGQQLAGGSDLFQAARDCVQSLRGTFAFAVVSEKEPGRIVGLRSGSPLLVALGEEGNFLTSDPLAVRGTTSRFIWLEEGDSVSLTHDQVTICDVGGKTVQRETVEITMDQEQAQRGEFPDYMLKEIYEQPEVARRQIGLDIAASGLPCVLETPAAKALASKVRSVHLVACGTSYHAALTASHWIEELAGLTCRVEIASEYRYRKVAVSDKTLFVTISQSGETADTLAALRYAKTLGYLSRLCICNVRNSSMARESELLLMTAAGPEVGVASTKAFTSQLIALLFMTIRLAKSNGNNQCTRILKELGKLPDLLKQALSYDRRIAELAKGFLNRSSTLFLGRGVCHCIAMEGALKLKEISYIHAEAVAAGELKHGTLALVDPKLAVVALIPKGMLQDKMFSNLEEVHARGGKIYALTSDPNCLPDNLESELIPVPECPDFLAPLLYVVPLQLLAYHVTIKLGLNVDQPRNLAKSVTVE